MKEISSTQIRAVGAIGKVQVATSVAAVCPYCSERVVFAMAEYNHDPHRQSVSSHAPCAACGRLTYFWSVMGVLDAEGNNPAIPVHHYMFPSPTSGYPQPNLPANVPDPLQRAFRSTIDSLNTRNFPATAVCARRTLEGIFKYLVAKDDREKSLYALIDQVKKNNDLAAPLETLSHAIRSGGNLGAHFDDENEPTEAMAHRMVELLDYLISYLYVLPSQITDLEKQLGKE
ncbi:DUF4145 domain-containing protein [Pseudomonas nitroreducens]|uniref:DUF4145 domain-containing protein n=1 Tax=Pseudomonas nitroreducens TaxID=46680 RepID=UPI00351CEA36